MNIVQQEFNKLMDQMFGAKNISENQKKDCEKLFFAGALSVNLAVLKCYHSKTPEKDIGELFDFVQKKSTELAGV